MSVLEISMKISNIQYYNISCCVAAGMIKAAHNLLINVITRTEHILVHF